MSSVHGILRRSMGGAYAGVPDRPDPDDPGAPGIEPPERREGKPPGRSGRFAALGVGLLLLLLSAAGYHIAGKDEPGTISNAGFFSNNSYVEGLYTNENAKNSAVVLRYVFRHLEDEVTVYPSENYYYFTLAMRGKTLSGDIHLDALGRDSGVISFGFVEKREDRSRAMGQYRPAWSREFGPADSLFVQKVNDFRYAITYAGRTVIFNLYDGDTLLPMKARLRDDEIYVGPTFDESGLRFFLIFNTALNKLYWVLNEDGFVPEEFSPVSDHVVMGDRTEFAFYLDSANNRKVLVGVQRLNVSHNNWYDGPFDQLPDNYVKSGRVEIRKYLAAHLGCDATMLDRYGNYTGREKEARALISPYMNYVLPGDLSFVENALAAGLQGAEFYGEITRERLNFSQYPDTATND